VRARDGFDVKPITIPVGALTFDALDAGPPDADLVLLLHGFPESAHEWRDVLPALATEGYHAVAPNQRGYSPGARPAGVGAYHVARLAEDVVGIAAALGAEVLHLVGHDWGALVAWYVAAHHPERLRTLSIVSVPHPLPFAAARADDPDQRERSQYIETFRRPEEAERFFLDDEAAILRAAYSELSPSAAAEHLRVLTDPGAMTAALNYYRAWDDALDSLGPVAVPTLFVWSTGDVALGRVAAEATADHVTGPYRFEVLDGVSHWIPEVASESLNPLLLRHLATGSSGRAP
jgi:pimeloyl-ACP methyl ester carboxylesterase